MNSHTFQNFLVDRRLLDQSPIIEKYYLQIGDHTVLDLLRETIRYLFQHSTSIYELPITKIGKQNFTIYQADIPTLTQVINMALEEIKQQVKQQKRFLMISFKQIQKEKNYLSDMREENNEWNLSWKLNKPSVLTDDDKKTYGVLGWLFFNSFQCILETIQQILRLFQYLFITLYVDQDHVLLKQIQQLFISALFEQYLRKDLDIFNLDQIIKSLAEPYKKQIVQCSQFEVAKRAKLVNYKSNCFEGEHYQKTINNFDDQFKDYRNTMNKMFGESVMDKLSCFIPNFQQKVESMLETASKVKKQFIQNYFNEKIKSKQIKNIEIQNTKQQSQQSLRNKINQFKQKKQFLQIRQDKKQFFRAQQQKKEQKKEQKKVQKKDQKKVQKKDQKKVQKKEQKKQSIKEEKKQQIKEERKQFIREQRKSAFSQSNGNISFSYKSFDNSLLNGKQLIFNEEKDEMQFVDIDISPLLAKTILSLRENHIDRAKISKRTREIKNIKQNGVQCIRITQYQCDQGNLHKLFNRISQNYSKDEKDDDEKDEKQQKEQKEDKEEKDGKEEKQQTKKKKKKQRKKKNKKNQQPKEEIQQPITRKIEQLSQQQKNIMNFLDSLQINESTRIECKIQQKVIQNWRKKLSQIRQQHKK